MKIKSIAQICKKNKCIFVYDKKRDDGSIDMQWIGDGRAMYPIFDLPDLGKESVFAIFDIPEKQREKFAFQKLDVPESLSLEDVTVCENMLNSGPIDISTADKILRPLQTQQGLAFIDTRYLAPLIDMADTLELYERITSSGQIYIAAKAGFMLMAIIMPNDLVNKEFVNQMEELTKQCNLALSCKEQKAAGT